jgi:hypothetical protein
VQDFSTLAQQMRESMNFFPGNDPCDWRQLRPLIAEIAAAREELRMQREYHGTPLDLGSDFGDSNRESLCRR